MEDGNVLGKRGETRYEGIRRVGREEMREGEEETEDILEIPHYKVDEL